MNELPLFIRPLLLTNIIEAVAAYLLGLRTWKLISLTILVNIVTNPLLVLFSLFLMYHLGIETGRLITYLILEPLVIMTEYLIYRKCLPQWNCLIMSLTLNILSLLGGLICQKII